MSNTIFDFQLKNPGHTERMNVCECVCRSGRCEEIGSVVVICVSFQCVSMRVCVQANSVESTERSNKRDRKKEREEKHKVNEKKNYITTLYRIK